MDFWQHFWYTFLTYKILPILDFLKIHHGAQISHILYIYILTYKKNIVCLSHIFEIHYWLKKMKKKKRAHVRFSKNSLRDDMQDNAIITYFWHMKKILCADHIFFWYIIDIRKIIKQHAHVIFSKIHQETIYRITWSLKAWLLVGRPKVIARVGEKMLVSENPQNRTLGIKNDINVFSDHNYVIKKLLLWKITWFSKRDLSESITIV